MSSLHPLLKICIPGLVACDIIITWSWGSAAPRTMPPFNKHKQERLSYLIDDKREMPLTASFRPRKTDH